MGPADDAVVAGEAPLDVTPITWGGRFSGGPDDAMLRLTSSLDVDIRLLEHDLAATKAHARVLEHAGLLDASDAAAVVDGCDSILADHRGGKLRVDEEFEDVHSLVEHELTQRVGEAGARIHAGRSRNDLVATDLRLWCKDAAGRCRISLATLIETVATLAEEHLESVMPGYTHLQRAQPVTLGFHLAAHGFALVRDVERFEWARSAADVSPLGAGALAGTTLPLDPSIAARELDFARMFDNAMDAVSDRDFACDLAYAASMCGVHLSRLAEEIVLWTTSEFGFARLADKWSTGSSMMPQKRNPDVAELTRARSAGGISDLVGLLTLLKGLPLAYDRDLQEDKTFLFAAVDRIERGLEAMTALLPALSFDAATMGAAAAADPLWATDLAEALVLSGTPFRRAHETVGALVAELEASGASPGDVIGARLETDTADVSTDPREGVVARDRPGGPAPSRVAEQIEQLRAAAGRARID